MQAVARSASHADSHPPMVMPFSSGSLSPSWLWHLSMTASSVDHILNLIGPRQCWMLIWFSSVKCSDEWQTVFFTSFSLADGWNSSACVCTVVELLQVIPWFSRFSLRPEAWIVVLTCSLLHSHLAFFWSQVVSLQFGKAKLLVWQENVLRSRDSCCLWSSVWGDGATLKSTVCFAKLSSLSERTPRSTLSFSICSPSSLRSASSLLKTFFHSWLDVLLPICSSWILIWCCSEWIVLLVGTATR